MYIHRTEVRLQVQRIQMYKEKSLFYGQFIKIYHLITKILQSVVEKDI